VIPRRMPLDAHDEPIINKHFDTLEELQSVIETRCVGRSSKTEK
jgi:hypothetical protein